MQVFKIGRKVVAKVFQPKPHTKKYYGENNFNLEFPKKKISRYCKDEKEVEFFIKKYYPLAKIKK